MSTFELFDQAVRWGLDGLHLDDGVLENLEESYLKEVRAAAEKHKLYLEYNFSMDLGGEGIGIQHDLAEAIATAKLLGADIVKVSMETALRMEKETVKRSIKYCREVLEITKDHTS